MAESGRISVNLDTTKAHEELDRLVERIESIFHEPEMLTVEEYEFPWWTFILSAFIGAMFAFSVLWVLVLVFI